MVKRYVFNRSLGGIDKILAAVSRNSHDRVFRYGDRSAVVQRGVSTGLGAVGCEIDIGFIIVVYYRDKLGIVVITAGMRKCCRVVRGGSVNCREGSQGDKCCNCSRMLLIIRCSVSEICLGFVNNVVFSENVS